MSVYRDSRIPRNISRLFFDSAQTNAFTQNCIVQFFDVKTPMQFFNSLDAIQLRFRVNKMPK